MSVSPEIFDWPASMVSARSLFLAGGQAAQGGQTLLGQNITTPEPGGRASLRMDFSTLKTERDNRLSAWVASKVTTGAIFRVPLFTSHQLVSLADLGLSPTTAELATGISFETVETGDTAYWDNDYGWAYEPVVLASAAGTEGDNTLVLDLSDYGEALQVGHVIGHMSRAYMVDAISYDGSNVATLKVSPPWRQNIAIGDVITFRPTMLGQVADASGFAGMFELGFLVKPGMVTFTEAMI